MADISLLISQPIPFVSIPNEPLPLSQQDKELKFIF